MQQGRSGFGILRRAAGNSLSNGESLLSTGPKILFLDIETSPIIMASWELRPPNASSVWVERDTFILCFAYKWAHEKKTHCLSLPDYPLYKKNKRSDKALAADIWKLLDEADCVIAHNGDRFDRRCFT